MRDQQAGVQIVVQSYRTRGSRARHIAWLVVAWLVFGLLWWRVLERPGALADARMMGLLLIAATLLVAVLGWGWIAHNVALARRRGGRRSVVPLRRPTSDRLGRRLEVAPEAAAASYVVVRVDGGTKEFVTGEPGDV